MGVLLAPDEGRLADAERNDRLESGRLRRLLLLLAARCVCVWECGVLLL